MKFIKSYVVLVNIDTEDGNNDAEWCTENWETTDLMDFVGQVRDDIENFIEENNLKNV